MKSRKNFDRLAGIIACLGGTVAVALGALGAHVLEKQLTPQRMELWDKAVRYQFYHTLALLAVSIFLRLAGRSHLLTAAAFLFAAGILFFSGSLYLLSTREITGLTVGWLGPVTPLGGLCWIAAWLMLGLWFYQKTPDNHFI
jgi:uncharacterized membrane protein YgdD (TMEM256/DUF423 family)